MHDVQTQRDRLPLISRSHQATCRQAGSVHGARAAFRNLPRCCCARRALVWIRATLRRLDTASAPAAEPSALGGRHILRRSERLRQEAFLGGHKPRGSADAGARRRGCSARRDARGALPQAHRHRRLRRARAACRSRARGLDAAPPRVSLPPCRRCRHSSLDRRCVERDRTKRWRS